MAINLDNPNFGCCYSPDQFDIITKSIFNLYFKTISSTDIHEVIDLRRLGEESIDITETYNDLLSLVIYLLMIKKQLLCDTDKTYLDFITDEKITNFKDYFFCRGIDIDCFFEKLNFFE